MRRRDALKAMVGGVAGLGFASFADESVAKPVALETESKVESPMKYTNKDYYKDGVFQQDKAFEAYYDMFAKMGYSLADSLRANPNSNTSAWAVSSSLTIKNSVISGTTSTSFPGK